MHVLNAACLRFFVNAFSISQSSFRTAYFQYQYKQRPKCHTQIKSIKKAYFTAYVSRIFGRSCSLKLTLKDLIISNKAKQQQQNKKKLKGKETKRKRTVENSNERRISYIQRVSHFERNSHKHTHNESEQKISQRKDVPRTMTQTKFVGSCNVITIHTISY